MRIEPDDCATYLERLGFGVERSDGDIVAEVPAHRYYDVSREADLVEEVGRIHGYDEHLPATLPQAPGQGGGLTREQALRRRAEDVMRDLGFDGIVSLSLVDPGLPSRLRLADRRRARARRSGSPTRCRSTTRSCARRCSARFSTPPATTSPAAPTASALSETGRAYLARGRIAGRRRPRGSLRRATARRRRSSRSASPPWRLGRSRRPSWGVEARPADFFAHEGRARGAGGASRRRGRARGRTAAVPPPGALGEGPHRRERGRLARRGPPAGLPRVGPGIGGRLPGRAGGARGGVAVHGRSLRGRHHVPGASTRTWRSWSTRTCPPTPCARAVVEGGGELLRGAAVFDVYHGEQVGEGSKSLALRLEFRAPDRTLTDAEVAERRDAIKAGARPRSEGIAP